MTTLSKSVKVKNAVSAKSLFYNIKNRLHFSSQYIEFNVECDGSVSEISAYTATHLVVTFSCCRITTARIIVQHRLERQEAPRDPVPASLL